MATMMVRDEEVVESTTVHLDMALLGAVTTWGEQQMAARRALRVHAAQVTTGRHRITFSSEGVDGITCEACQDILLQAWSVTM